MLGAFIAKEAAQAIEEAAGKLKPFTFFLLLVLLFTAGLFYFGLVMVGITQILGLYRTKLGGTQGAISHGP